MLFVNQEKICARLLCKQDRLTLARIQSLKSLPLSRCDGVHLDPGRDLRQPGPYFRRSLWVAQFFHHRSGNEHASKKCMEYVGGFDLN